MVENNHKLPDIDLHFLLHKQMVILFMFTLTSSFRYYQLIINHKKKEEGKGLFVTNYYLFITNDNSECY